MSFLPTRDIWDLDKLPTVVQTSYPADRKMQVKVTHINNFYRYLKNGNGGHQLSHRYHS